MVITEECFCIIFEYVRPRNIFAWIYSVLLPLPCQRPLNWQRIHNGYSTMSDGIFVIVHRTFPLTYFRSCWFLDACVCVIKVCGHHIKQGNSRVGHHFSEKKNLANVFLIVIP